MILTIFNNKGGCCKTTLARELAGFLSITIINKKVLIIDLDHQNGIAISFGIEPNSTINHSILSIIKDNRNIQSVIYEFNNKISIIFADPNLKYYDHYLKQINLNKNLTALLNKLKQYFDLIILDLAPNLSSLNLVALKSTDVLLMPFEAERQNVEGIFSTLDSLKKFEIKIKDIFAIGVKWREKGFIDKKILEFLYKELSNKNHEVIVLNSKLPFSNQFKNWNARKQSPLILSESTSKVILKNKAFINVIGFELLEIIIRNFRGLKNE